MLLDVRLKSIVFTWLTTGTFVFWHGAFGAGNNEYRAECGIFTNITANLNKEKRGSMHCVKNAQCTGFDCDGKYKYQGIVTGFKAVTINYCFGMALHPCHKPVDMHFYVEQEGKPATNENMSANSLVPIRAVHYKLGKLGSVDGFMDVKFSRVQYKGKTIKVHVSMTFKIRLNTPIGHTWPSSFQRVLVEDTLIPVPACDKSVSTPTSNAKCFKYTGTPFPSTTPTPGKKQCKPGVLYSGCLLGQVCKKVDKNYYCECVNPDPYGRCGGSVTKATLIPDKKTTPKGTKVKPTKLPSGAPNAHNSGKGSGNKNTIIISTCTVGAVLLVGVVLAVMLFKYKRHRERYGRHDVLLNNEDDQDDIVI